MVLVGSVGLAWQDHSGTTAALVGDPGTTTVVSGPSSLGLHPGLLVGHDAPCFGEAVTLPHPCTDTRSGPAFPAGGSPGNTASSREDGGPLVTTATPPSTPTVVTVLASPGGSYAYHLKG